MATRKSKKKKEYKLDLFKDVLPNIDKKNRDFWSSLTEEEQKAFQPYVVIQFLCGTNDPAQIYYLNELVNPFVFDFGSKHKELLINLMMVCSTGKKRYRWIKKKSAGNPKSIGVIQEYFNYSRSQAEDAFKCLSGDDIVGFAEEIGYQNNELKELKKETHAISDR